MIFCKYRYVDEYYLLIKKHIIFMIWFKIIYAASTYDFAVNIIMVINIWYSWFACKLFMLLREYEYFQCFNIYTIGLCR